MRAPMIALLVTFTASALSVGSAGAGPCSQEIADVTKRLAASDAGTGPSTGTPAPTAGDQPGRHPGTGLISKETQGKATSPADVQRQSGVKADASQALERARGLEAQGKEAECMREVMNAKQLAGL
jgi:hypothetical protein